MSITLYRNKGAPLTTDEVDDNFDSLLPKDGSAPLEGNLTIQGLNINIDNASNRLTIGGSSSIIDIPGTLNTTAELNPTVNGKTFTVDADSTTKSDSDGAGIKIGNSVINLLYNSTSDAWEATTNVTGEGVKMKSEDFITDANGSLSTTISNVGDLELFTGSNGSSSPSYSGTNYLTSETTLQDAVIRLDAEINNIATVTTNYTEENTVTSGESLQKGIDDLDIHSKYTITKFEERTNNVEALSGTEYMITPSSNETVEVTLPETKKGTVAIRLMNNSDGRQIRVAGSIGDSIEKRTTDAAIISNEGQTIYFVWDTTEEGTWRIR